MVAQSGFACTIPVFKSTAPQMKSMRFALALMTSIALAACSGGSGTSGTSGTGFNAIANPSDNRILTSDGTTNAANAESNLTFDGNTFTVTGDTVITGKLTAQEFYTELVSSSIIFESGSTKFGDTLDDKHQFTGSLQLTGSISVKDLELNNLSKFVIRKPLKVRLPLLVKHWAWLTLTWTHLIRWLTL